MEKKEIKRLTELSDESSEIEELYSEFYDYRLQTLATKIKSQIYRPKAKTIFL